MPPCHCPVSGTARSVGRVTLGMGTDCQGAYRGHRAVEKYISANSKPELLCIIDRSKSADLYFLADQPVPESRPLPGIRAARGPCASDWAGPDDGSARYPPAVAWLAGNHSSATRNRDRLGQPLLPGSPVGRRTEGDADDKQPPNRQAAGAGTIRPWPASGPLRVRWGNSPRDDHHRRRRKSIRLAITVGFQGVQRDQRSRESATPHGIARHRGPRSIGRNWRRHLGRLQANSCDGAQIN